MTTDTISLLGFVALAILLIIRTPVGFAMGLVGIGGFAAIVGPGPAVNLLGLSVIRTIANWEFGLIPMFILMGAVATEGGMSGILFRACDAWLGRLRGGLALATIGASGGFAAICGSSVATAASMTRIALPEMRRAGYADGISAGVIAAGGTLGILIPPSVVLALYGIIVEQDIGQLFIAGIVPGLLALALHFATVLILGRIGAGLPSGRSASWQERFGALKSVWPITLLFVFVIGGIYTGAFTPTEAAGMGAAGAVIITAAMGTLDWKGLRTGLVSTVGSTAAIFTVLVGAVLFSQFLAITGTPQRLAETLVELPIGPTAILGLMLTAFVLLGCILDAMAMVILMVPIVFPLIVELGFDPIWFGVVVVITVELGLITPPVGMNVFVIRAIAPELKLPTIYKGVTPFVLADIARLALLVAFPQIALYLPSQMN